MKSPAPISVPAKLDHLRNTVFSVGDAHPIDNLDAGGALRMGAPHCAGWGTRKHSHPAATMVVAPRVTDLQAYLPTPQTALSLPSHRPSRTARGMQESQFVTARSIPAI